MNKKILIAIISILVISISIYFILNKESNYQQEVYDENIEFPDTNIDNLDLTTETLTGSNIVITSSGTYNFEGEYESINVNVDKETDSEDVYLVFNNVTINNDEGTPINIVEAKNIIILLEDNTYNKITQGNITTDDQEFPSSAIYSKADLLITGNGTLEVITSYNDAINSRDDLIIQDSTIIINAVGDGLVGKDLVAIENSNITIEALKDGIKSSNTEDSSLGNILITSGIINIKAQNDGINSQNSLQIDGGEFNITTGGGFKEVLNDITMGEGPGTTIQPTDLLEDSMKSLKGEYIIINDGIFNLSSYEDAIHSNNSLLINNGEFDILSGDDAIHADTDLVINDGIINIENAYEGIEGSSITINGGNLNVVVLDDGINASEEEGFIKITGGTLYVYANGDGIDSNGDLIVTGGTTMVEVDAIYSGGDSELDVGGNFEHTGGTLTDENNNQINPIEDAHSNPRR